MVAILKMSAKFATLSFLKIKIFLNECYDAIIFVYDRSKKVLSCKSNHIVDVGMYPKFRSSSS